MLATRALMVVSLLFSGSALLGCSTSLTGRRSILPQSAEAANALQAPRPILYCAVEGERPNRTMVIRAIHPDGRSLGTLARGELGGWSRQGDRFAYLVTKETTQTPVVNVMGREGRPETIYETNGVRGVVLAPGQSIWSPDGSMIALLLADGETFSLGVVEVATKKVRTFKLPRSVQPDVEEGHIDPLYVYVKWSPDGRKILLGSAALDLERNTWEAIADRRVIAEWLPRSEGVYFFELWQRGGDLLLKESGRNGAATVLAGSTLAGWGAVSLASPNSAPLLRLSPSRSRLAIAAWAGPEEATAVLVFDIPADRPGSLAEPARRVQVDGILIAMAWGPDERKLAVLSAGPGGDLMVGVVDLESGAWTSLAKAAHPETVHEIEALLLRNTISWCD